MSRQKAYIYSLIDPNTEKVMYVGVTGDPRTRLQSHLSSKENKPKDLWIQELRAAKKLPVMRIERVVDWTNRLTAEIQVATEYNKKGEAQFSIADVNINRRTYSAGDIVEPSERLKRKLKATAA